MNKWAHVYTIDHFLKQTFRCFRPLRWGLLSTEYRRESARSRDTNKMIWISFLGNGITEQKKKSTAAKVLLLRMPLCFSFFVPSSRSKVLSWSVDIEPTLKSVLNNTVDNENVVLPLKILQNYVLIFFSKRSVMAGKFRIGWCYFSRTHTSFRYVLLRM